MDRQFVVPHRAQVYPTTTSVVLHNLHVCRAVFKEQAAENKFFESQEVDVQHAQLATAMFIDPAAPPL